MQISFFLDVKKLINTKLLCIGIQLDNEYGMEIYSMSLRQLEYTMSTVHSM